MLPAVMFAVFAACSDNNNDSDLVADYQEVAFDASVAQEGLDLGWKEGDAVSVFDGKANHKFTATGSGDVVRFSGTANVKAAAYMGLRPYHEGLSRYGGKVNVEIPSSQVAVKDGINVDYLLMAGYSKVPVSEMDFKLMPAILKLDISAEDYNVVSVQISAKGEEVISGDCSIGLLPEPEISARPEGSSKVTLTGENLSGVYYVATIPQTLSEGLVVSISDENDARCEISVPAMETKPGEIVELEKMTGLELKEAVNPDPTSVSGAVILKASFSEADFNILSDPSFEDYPDMAIGARSSWKGINPAVARIAGHTGSYGWRLDNAIPGVWMELYTQCVGFRKNTDYVYSMYGMAGTPHAYNGVRLFPANIGIERGGVGPNSWSDYEEDTQWVYVDKEFNTGTNFYGDIFAGLWGDAGAFISVDDVRVIPKGYDKKSMATLSVDHVASVSNATFDEVKSFGKVVAWKCDDGKIAFCFSNPVINGVKYSTAVAYTENDSFDGNMTISKFIKSKGRISEISSLATGELSIVPDAVFRDSEKLYMHYFTTAEETSMDSWKTSRTGFLVSADDGKTWSSCGDAFWTANGKFAQAGVARKDGYTYIIGSEPGRSNDWYRNFFVARASDGKDFTSPLSYEYWTGNEYESVEESSVGGDALITVGDISEPSLIWNAKFGRWMLIYRSNKHCGLVYRDSDSPEGFWSGEKILTDDDKTGILTAPEVLGVDEDGNILILATRL